MAGELKAHRSTSPTIPTGRDGSPLPRESFSRGSVLMANDTIVQQQKRSFAPKSTTQKIQMLNGGVLFLLNYVYF